MIDPELSLAFNVHSQPGVYALLLGSGISRSSGIPTGWEITLDLVAKIAHMEEEDCGTDPAGWYFEKYGEEPNYSLVISRVASTQAAQQGLLKPYFEPTEQEREDSEKLPTEAHKAIAALVRTKHIRVIVTTNFDRLLESALEQEGIAPIVISSNDAVKGAPPLAHSKCTIVKIHGDYLDQRIKNSPADLAKYTKQQNDLLDKIFDEYGLIVSGWSAEYDEALVSGLKRKKSRRYPMYWTHVGEAGSCAKELVNFCQGELVKTEGADTFFPNLLEKTNALTDFEQPHPLSKIASTTALKKYVSEKRHHSKLFELVISEAKQTSSCLEELFTRNSSPSLELIEEIESQTDCLRSLFSIASFYGDENHSPFLFDAFRLIAATAPPLILGIRQTEIRRYPGLLLIYAAGISGLARNKFSLLAQFSNDALPTSDRKFDDQIIPLVFNTSEVIHRGDANQVLSFDPVQIAPLSLRLNTVLRDTLIEIVPDEAHYNKLFDEFEFLWTMLYVQSATGANRQINGVPFGRYIATLDNLRSKRNTLIAQTTKPDQEWNVMIRDLFNGSRSSFFVSLQQVNHELEKFRTNSPHFLWN